MRFTKAGAIAQDLAGAFPIAEAAIPPSAEYQYNTVRFTTPLDAPIGDPGEPDRLTINFRVYSSSADTTNVYVDDVSLAAIPEPTSAGFLGVIGAGLLLCRRRRAEVGWGVFRGILKSPNVAI